MTKRTRASLPNRSAIIIAAAAIVTALFAGIAGLIIAIMSVFSPDSQIAGGGINTRSVPGDPAHFDPFAALPVVQEFAGEGARLVSIDIRLVRADGTQDLEAKFSPAPRTTYIFVRDVPPPANAAPPGAGGANTGPWTERITIEAYEPGHRRLRSRIGDGSNQSVGYTNKGLDMTRADPVSGTVETVPSPACTIPNVFARAIAMGAQMEAVATVSYNADGYTFSITGLALRLQFDQRCDLFER